MSESSEQGRAGVVQVAKRSVQKFMADDMTTYAAALSYQVFFALFPFIIFLLALLGFLNIPGFFNSLLEQSQAILPQGLHEPLEGVINQIRGGDQGGLFSLGIILALYSASGAVRLGMHALNVAYGVGGRPVWKKFPLSVAYTLVLAVLIIVAVGLMLIGPQALQTVANQIGGLGSLFVALWAWLRIPVAIILIIVILTLIYRLFPNTHQRVKFIIPGAVISTIIWVAASLGFFFYVSNFGSYNATYGALGAVIVLLLYLFISAAVMLLGAEVNAEIYRAAAEEDKGEQRSS